MSLLRYAELLSKHADMQVEQNRYQVTINMRLSIVENGLAYIGREICHTCLLTYEEL